MIFVDPYIDSVYLNGQEAEKRMEELQQELDMRNAQLADLQQQILSFNEDKEKDKSGDRSESIWEIGVRMSRISNQLCTGTVRTLPADFNIYCGSGTGNSFERNPF